MPEDDMPTIKSWEYTPRADMSADIRDLLELVKYLEALEMRVVTLERQLQKMKKNRSDV